MGLQQESVRARYGARNLRFEGILRLATRGGWQSKFGTARRVLGEKHLVGSVPPPSDGMWQIARNLGFKVRTLERVATADGRAREQAVDDCLQKRMLALRPPSFVDQLLVILGVAGKPIVALFSGDGNDNGGHGGFPEVVEELMRRGFDIEIYGFESSTSQALKKLTWKAARVIFLDGNQATMDQFTRIKQ